jgi:HsdM N-terminal domain
MLLAISGNPIAVAVALIAEGVGYFAIFGVCASCEVAVAWRRQDSEAPMPDPNLSSFIWSVADLLRGDYKQSEYGKVVLPFTVFRTLWERPPS